MVYMKCDEDREKVFVTRYILHKIICKNIMLLKLQISDPTALQPIPGCH
ncbi:hypothetical protein HMPREF1536_00482 [Parabacteroides gordonii MS-1 = DSM 23371]|uniref:Uncharacterized protein n=1 Tax=Parabacteroides gordonii MS-1 = DSM 23371 TaxID=1203610 RepID=A0A0F5JS03_9BACT|nr:hypothetical protein HMPREF1536_00482 [Parabacteroides gordonii MS-1 = DSM 23371]